MAVDTREKRASIIGIGLAAALVLPAPDASVVLGDRQQVAFTYMGIAAGEPPPSVVAIVLEATARYAPILAARGGA
jgi:hypothetical protein